MYLDSRTIHFESSELEPAMEIQYITPPTILFFRSSKLAIPTANPTMHSLASLPLIAAFLAATVSAHGYVSDATIGGTTYTGYLPYSDPYYSVPPQRIFRKIPGNGPVEDLTSVDLQCNGYQNSGSTPAPLTATAAAGSTVSLHWTTWPDSHHGPVITYMAKCPGSCTTYSPGTAAVWFKIKEEGVGNIDCWA
jgi:hypothetical protein